MNERDFIYWLHGFAELNPNPPTAAQWKSIKEHLDLLFTKVTPEVGKKKEDEGVDWRRVFEEAEKRRRIAEKERPIFNPEPWEIPHPWKKFPGEGQLLC